MYTRIASLLSLTGIFLWLFAFSAQAQMPDAEKKEIRAFLEEWLKANNSKDLQYLRDFYQSDLIFYGQDRKLEDCLNEKEGLKNEHPDLHECLDSNFTLTHYRSGIVKCDFSKTVLMDKKSFSQPYYLLLHRYSSGWKIVGESDPAVDKYLNYQLQLGTPIDGEEQHGSGYMPYLTFFIVLAVLGLAAVFVFRFRKKSEV